jgi:Ion channel
MLATLLAAGFMLALTVTLHSAGLNRLRRHVVAKPNHGHMGLAAVVASVVLLHVLEIGLFGLAIWVLNVVIDVGDIVGTRDFTAFDYFYYSAETFTALGTGDINATGGLRLIATFEPLVGLTLIAWSGAFTYWVMEHLWVANK